jgi:hypothetical protein
MKSSIAHDIKHRENPNDEFMTPPDLAKVLYEWVNPSGTVLDSARGTGNFTFDLSTDDFLNWTEKVDWIVTNPPYSKIDKYLEHSCEVADKGFSYLLGLHNLTAKRIEICEKQGFYITRIYLCKVFKWFGMSAMIVWEKNGTPILSYDRKVWREL